MWRFSTLETCKLILKGVWLYMKLLDIMLVDTFVKELMEYEGGANPREGISKNVYDRKLMNMVICQKFS